MGLQPFLQLTSGTSEISSEIHAERAAAEHVTLTFHQNEFGCMLVFPLQYSSTLLLPWLKIFWV